MTQGPFGWVVFWHPYLGETFGLKLLSIKDKQHLLMVTIYGMIRDHFWNFRFSFSQENWGQRRLMCEKVGIWDFFFLKINFLLHSILFLWTMVTFHLKVAKNCYLSVSNLRKFATQQRSRTLVESWLSQIWKGQISILGYF